MIPKLVFVLVMVSIIVTPALSEEGESSLFESMEVRVGIRPLQDASFRPGDKLTYEQNGEGGFSLNNQGLAARLEVVFETASGVELLLNVNHARSASARLAPKSFITMIRASSTSWLVTPAWQAAGGRWWSLSLIAMKPSSKGTPTSAS